MVAISMLESNFSGEEGNWCPLEGAELLLALQAAPTRSAVVSIASSLLPGLSPEKGKAFQNGEEKRTPELEFSSCSAL